MFKGHSTIAVDTEAPVDDIEDWRRVMFQIKKK